MEPRPGEIYIEFSHHGTQLRAVAVDAGTGVEVTVFGPASVSRHDLARIAVRKLERRLAGMSAD
ncbi:DUF6898 family protein [Tepidamorphus gemmatus]|uniref:DUF6898 family protein n=1 Tax=Tepidamorphus gemmatus TaxID=747076 RepID=UPI001A9E7BF2|nr:hypothetical protein [Tepidamorphus gemmatus]